MTNEATQEHSPLMPHRVWLTQCEVNGFKTLVQASGHDTNDAEYVRGTDYHNLALSLRNIVDAYDQSKEAGSAGAALSIIRRTVDRARAVLERVEKQ